MSEKKGLGLPQTKGTFQFRGKATGVEKDSFYKDKPTKTGKPFRMVNFGIQINNDETQYVALTGMEKEKVYFSKSVEENGKRKTEVEHVAWKDRFTFNKEDFRLIGINLGLTKKTDDKGNEVNNNKTLVEFDACGEINTNLKDGQSLFVKGNIDYSHFKNNKDEVKRSTKFVPSQISLCKKDIDFEDENFEPMADFTQQIIFMGINKVENRFVVEAKIVNYNSVEDVEFFIDDSSLANKFKKGLKPYHSIKVWGNVVSKTDTTEVSDDSDVWGESNSMDRVNTPTVREMIITGADGTNIDKETYSEEIIDNAIAKMNANKNAEKEYGNKDDDWGSVPSASDDEW